MSAGLIAIVSLAALVLVTTVAAFSSDVRNKGWRDALLSLGALLATVAGFSALVVFVVAP